MKKEEIILKVQVKLHQTQLTLYKVQLLKEILSVQKQDIRLHQQEKIKNKNDLDL